MILTLPFPPSVNSMFRNVNGRGRVKSAEYKAWLVEAGVMLKQQKPRPPNGRVRITVDLDDKRRGDADNRIKPIIDLLVAHGVIPDDSKTYVKRMSIGWERVDDCVVSITPV